MVYLEVVMIIEYLRFSFVEFWKRLLKEWVFIFKTASSEESQEHAFSEQPVTLAWFMKIKKW